MWWTGPGFAPIAATQFLTAKLRQGPWLVERVASRTTQTQR